ncbi:unnamed protein product [Vicia faba]|uniref:Uncharacterized protein n=1 Tax=Vicia faba TaxID=3906 RepID=A0AAV0YFB1_VICFA|nr:unnamed protein product [Vicia faba]
MEWLYNVTLSMLFIGLLKWWKKIVTLIEIVFVEKAIWWKTGGEIDCSEISIYSGRSIGFGFGTFGSAEEVNSVIHSLDDVCFHYCKRRSYWRKDQVGAEEAEWRCYMGQLWEIFIGLFDNLVIEPQVERIGKYKRKKIEDIENFIHEGVYQVDKQKQEGFISNILCDDEVLLKPELLLFTCGRCEDDNMQTIGVKLLTQTKHIPTLENLASQEELKDSIDVAG